MGDRIGSTAPTRLTYWAYLNQRFCPYEIENTATAFDNWLNDENIDINVAISSGRFPDFATYLGCSGGWMPNEAQKNAEHSRILKGWNLFEPGLSQIVSLVVFSNLKAHFPNSVSHPMLKDDAETKNGDTLRDVFYPRPMVFERTFSDKEEVVVRSTKYGIKIVLQSLTEAEIRKRLLDRLEEGKEVGFTDVPEPNDPLGQ